MVFLPLALRSLKQFVGLAPGDGVALAGCPPRLSRASMLVFRFNQPYAPLLQRLDVTEAPILP